MNEAERETGYSHMPFGPSARVKGLALTFDDVLLAPRFSLVLPSEVSLRTRLAGEIFLNLPLISAAMDTVTESKMAIAMAREGGLGIIHKGLSIKRQVEEVTLVKRSQSGQITKPYTLMPSQRLSDVRALMAEKGISGVPIIGAGGKLVGLVTKRDIGFFGDDDNPVIADFMLKENLVTAGPDTTLDQAKAILQQHRIEKLLLVDDNGILRGLITFRDIRNVKEYPLATRDVKGRLTVGAAVGVSADFAERVAALVEAGADVLCLDSSHGHSHGVIDAVSRIKARYDTLPLIAGNVCTMGGASALSKAGADAIKVGVGPGSICTTRVVNGCGMPQISAILEAVKGADTIPIIADGGIRYSGDIVKALAAGASTVMLGSLLAGTLEAPGEEQRIGGKVHKVYRGMGSESAMKKSGADRYFQEGANKFVPEGIEGVVPLKGWLSEVIYQQVGGIRSGMGMLGAKDIRSLWEAEFVQVTQAGVRESHPHDVLITKEASNYPVGGND